MAPTLLKQRTYKSSQFIPNSETKQIDIFTRNRSSQNNQETSLSFLKIEKSVHGGSSTNRSKEAGNQYINN